MASAAATPQLSLIRALRSDHGRVDLAQPFVAEVRDCHT